MKDNNIRRIIGALGILLPVILIVVNLIYGCTSIQDSISHYYYTYAGHYFTGVLVFVGAFLIAYGGYSKSDRIACRIAGVCALLIAFLPTGASENHCGLFTQSRSTTISHLVVSGIFFATLAIISLFLFTKSSGEKTEQKKKRNRLYRVCGLIIFSCLIAIAGFQMAGIDRATFWLEWVGLKAFGLSWLVKGETILKDKP